MVWLLFIVLIFVLLTLDLGVFHKKVDVIGIKESIAWTSIWVILALSFGGVIYFLYDQKLMGLNEENISPAKAMIQFYSGYLIEESLSLDNIFVMAMIFIYFKIDTKYQHNILFWGIIGAVFFRLLMILLGTSFVKRFEWSMFVFGLILIYSALKMFQSRSDEKEFKDSIGIRLLSKIYPIDWNCKNGKYFVNHMGKRMATPLFASLAVIEFSDILFAVDSIPAIFSVTKDPFIVFTSNIFAILGLRSLFFFLSGMMDKFQYINYSLIVILLFVGIKMLIEKWVEISPLLSLCVIVLSFVSGILLSVLSNEKKE